MQIHDPQAIKRNIRFKEIVDVKIDVRASDRCCWNCLQSRMLYNGLWCERDMEEVDFRDLCNNWEERKKAE